jgi:drug/metabolite transporter (DMT)-like permease
MIAQARLTPLTWGLLLLLALIWGGSFPANRAALAEVPVLTVVAIRVGGAAVLMWAWVRARGVAVPRGWRWVAVFLGLGVMNNALPFTLIVWGQSHIESGLAGILNAATAIFGVLVGALVFADERLTAAKAVGVALGFAGVVAAIGADKLDGLDLTSLGQLAVLGAALCYAVTTVAARRLLKGVAPEVSAAGMLTGAAAVMVPLALATDGMPALGYSAATWASLAYLAAVSSALAYVLYYIVLARAGASNLSLVTLMVAPVAILLGALLFGERLDWTAYAGFGLLTLGLLVIDGRVALPGRARAG